MFHLNSKVMISGKGILYTVLGAAASAAIAGTMLTGGVRGEKMRRMTSGLQNLIGSLKRKAQTLTTPQETRNRAEFNQASGMSNMGHA
jgi:hypothetical protein